MEWNGPEEWNGSITVFGLDKKGERNGTVFFVRLQELESRTK
jgi:hypothetical protein